MKEKDYYESLNNLAESLMADRRARLVPVITELAIGGVENEEPPSNVQVDPSHVA